MEFEKKSRKWNELSEEHQDKLNMMSIMFNEDISYILQEDINYAKTLCAFTSKANNLVYIANKGLEPPEESIGSYFEHPTMGDMKENCDFDVHAIPWSSLSHGVKESLSPIPTFTNRYDRGLFRFQRDIDFKKHLYLYICADTITFFIANEGVSPNGWDFELNWKPEED